MDLTLVIILAVVQGMTEFLPVSSSGHLVVSAAVLETLGWEKPPQLLELEIILHVGTLLAVIVFYWQRIWRLMGEDRRVVALLAVGTIPAVAVGVPLKKYAPHVLENPLLAGAMFLVTAAILIWVSRREPGEQEYESLGYRQALAIGLFQAAAILPGISRSGATISAGLMTGLNRRASGAFAFLLAIPVIGGAGLLQLKDLVEQSRHAGGDTLLMHLPTLMAGLTVSFLVGLIALWALIRIVERGRLAWFACWLIPLGIVVVAWQMVATVR